MNSEAQISEVLGGGRVIGRNLKSYADFDEVIRSGFPWKAVSHAKDSMSLTDRELSSLLDVSERTLSRLKKSGKRLTMSASDRLFRVANIFASAKQVFESEEAALKWLHNPQIGLGGRVPLDMIMTEAGTHEVENLLGRIEYGVIA